MEPGASEVFTQGRVVRPRSTAFLARSPAARSTAGLEVLVHEVMAAITTEPWCRLYVVSRLPTVATAAGSFGAIAASSLR